MSYDEWTRDQILLLYDGGRTHWHDWHFEGKETYRRQGAALTRRNLLHLALFLGFCVASVHWPPAIALSVATFLLYRHGLAQVERLDQEKRQWDALHYALHRAVSLGERDVVREVLRELTRSKPPSR